MVLGIIALFVSIALSPVITAFDKDIDMNESINNSDDEILDQYQLENNTFLYLWGPWWQAQSFKPSSNTLSRIEILGSSYNLTVPLEISIRQNLTGSDLSNISIPPNELPTTKTWIEINLPDIHIIPETIYYIVLRNTGDNNHAFRWYAIHDVSDHYTRGSPYWSNNSGQNWIPLDEP